MSGTLRLTECVAAMARTTWPTPSMRPGRARRSTAERGSAAAVTFRVVCGDGSSPNAVIPLKIIILDAEGKEAEFSGFHAAVKGEVTLRLEPAPNETPGTWQIIAEELASGKTAKVTIQLK